MDLAGYTHSGEPKGLDDDLPLQHYLCTNMRAVIHPLNTKVGIPLLWDCHECLAALGKPSTHTGPCGPLRNS